MELRNQLAAAVKEKLTGAEFKLPELKYCTDNAAMIATAGYYRARPPRKPARQPSKARRPGQGVAGAAKRKNFTPWQKLKTEPNLELK